MPTKGNTIIAIAKHFATTILGRGEDITPRWNGKHGGKATANQTNSTNQPGEP
jgi:hypothetical protein